MNETEYAEFLINEIDKENDLKERITFIEDEIQRMEVQTINLRRDLLILKNEEQRRIQENGQNNDQKW